MNIWQNELWLKLFGSVWKTLTEADAGIGAFAVFHDSGEVLIDGNARRMLGLDGSADRETVKDALEKVEQTFPGYPLRVYMLDTDENVTAGFMRLEDDFQTDQNAYIFPLQTQSQLIKLMSDGAETSLLALAQIEGTGNSAHTACCVTSALNAISEILPDNAVIASHSKLQYWIYIPSCIGDPEVLLEKARRAVKECELTDEFGVTVAAEHSMTLTAGYTDLPAPAAQRLHYASFALFEAQSEGCGSVCGFSPERYELQKNQFRDLSIFSRLMDRNLFRYHFQPIVSARTGEIVAYEALMRTDENIGLSPMQILDIAKDFGRLYDIEKATLNNTLAYLGKHQEDFGKRKLFINSITSHLLRDDDYQKLRADYGELLEKVVIELTEQTEITDEDLERIHRRLKEDNMQLAIDDYGTGYSNTSNLLRYNPDIVKIDRSLISGIDKDHKMRGIVSGIIDFLHASGYIALAEGVETAEELRAMIGFGADLIQGYYVSRPKPVLIREISESVRKEIMQINLESGGVVQKIYHPKENETVDVCRLALEKYTGIFVSVPSVTLVGDPEQTAAVNVTVKEDTDCSLTLRNVNLISNTEVPVIRLGSYCSVHMTCSGSNKISLKGIFVPRTASLRISGTGDLDVSAEAMNCFAIGSDCDHTCGNITVDMTGRLSVAVNGERCVGIGSGKNSENNRIKILGGDISVSCSGENCVGIGIIDGNAIIEMSDCACSVVSAAINSAAIGALRGSADISVQSYSLNCRCSGGTQTAIGVTNGGSGKIRLSNGRLNVVMKGKSLACIGSRKGDMACETNESRIDLYCEGGAVSGIGDIDGGSDVSMTDTDLFVTFLTGNGVGIGAAEGKVNIKGGSSSIKINE